MQAGSCAFCTISCKMCGNMLEYNPIRSLLCKNPSDLFNILYGGGMRLWQLFEEVYGQGYGGGTGHAIDPTGTRHPHATHYAAGIVGLEEPTPSEEGGQQGHCAAYHEYGQDDVVGRHWNQSVIRRLPSGCSSMLTLTTSNGRSSSTSSGHSMKQRAPQ